MKRWIGMIASLLLIGFIYQAKGVSWTIEKVTDNTEEDVDPVIAIDRGDIYIAYTHNDGDGEVFLATNVTGVWQNHRITDNTRYDFAYDISARNEDIYIAIQWQDTPDMEISYCKGRPGSWNIERVTDDVSNNEWPSMAIDKNDYAHIAYMKDHKIFYANNVTGSWKEEQVTDDGDYPSLALNRSGNPHIVFVRGGSHIFYIRKEAGIWREEKIVDIVGIMTSMVYSNLALDKSGFAHLAYFNSDGTDEEIYYTNNVTGSWQESKVTDNDFPDIFPALALDSHSRAHIIYLTSGGGIFGQIFYANNTTNLWDISRVTDSPINNHIAYLRRCFILDNKGFGHITFFNNEDGDDEIYYAKSNEPLFTGIEEKGVALPKTLLKVYPNPSNGFSVISYQLPAKSRADIGIYDATGRLIKNFRAEPGNHRVIWHRDNLPSGVYFCRLTTKGFSITQKVIVK